MRHNGSNVLLHSTPILAFFVLNILLDLKVASMVMRLRAPKKTAGVNLRYI